MTALTVNDRREPGDRAAYPYLVLMTDRALSGWGGAAGGSSVAAWACTAADVDRVEAWVRSRSDALRVRVVRDDGPRRYRPRNAAHFSVYVVHPGHPARGGAR